MNRRPRIRPLVALAISAMALVSLFGGCASPPGETSAAVPPVADGKPGPLSGLSVRVLDAKRKEGLKHLSAANTNADAWRILKDDSLRKEADAGYQAAVSGHEELLKAIRAKIQAADPMQGGMRTVQALQEEHAVRGMEWNLQFELAQMYIFWGRLYPDDNPDPDKANAKVERGNTLLNDLRQGIMERLKMSKAEIERDVIPPSFYFLKAIVTWQRGKVDEALGQFNKAIEEMKPRPEMAGALVQTYFNKVEFLLEKALGNKELFGEIFGTVDALLNATKDSKYAPMQKRALLMKAKVLLLQGKAREALDLAKPYLGDPDSRIRRVLAAAIREEAAKVLPPADIPPLPPEPPARDGISNLPVPAKK